MKNVGNLQITTPSDREIAMTRAFDAPRRLVFEALTRPELLARWLLGPAGWTMTTCEIDLRVGGAYRYEWHKLDGTSMGMGGVYREIAPPERLVATELFDDPWYSGEALVTWDLVEQRGVTTLTITVRYESKDARDGVLASPMEEGMSAGFDRLAQVLAAQQPR